MRDFPIEIHLLSEMIKELKFYLLTFQPELKEIGIDGVNLAWQIYKTNQK